MRAAAAFGAAWAIAFFLPTGTGAAPPAPAFPLWGGESATWVQGGREFYVGPNGAASNPGTRQAPWDMKSTMDNAHQLRGGDVVWVMNGIYKGCFEGRFSGSRERPVVIRAVPGDRAVLDGSDLEAGNRRGRDGLLVSGPWTVFWGLEITNSDRSVMTATSAYHGGPDDSNQRPAGFSFEGGVNSKLINCFNHDTGGNGVWSSAPDSEIYGCIIRSVGQQRQGRGQGTGHALYTQNKDGIRRIRENIICYGFRNGIDAYTTNGYLRGFEIVGNVLFCASAAANEGGKKMDLLIGGPCHPGPPESIMIKDNLLWANRMDRTASFGYGSRGKDIRLIGNTFAGQVKFAPWEKLEITGNQFLGPVDGSVNPRDYPANVYGGRPREAVVHVRPNEYEPGRGHVIVYNWADQDTVRADIRTVVPLGARFVIRNAQNLDQKPVAGGVYDGKPVTLPMAGMDPPQPLGCDGFITRDEMTGRAFNAFLVESGPAATGVNARFSAGAAH
jgi:hypothetical protein